MDDTQIMLRTIINNQSHFRQEVLSRMDKMEARLDGKIDSLDKKLSGRIDIVEENLTKRLDKIGKQLAYLEDDTPSREEFDNLQKMVDQLEQKVSPLGS